MRTRNFSESVRLSHIPGDFMDGVVVIGPNGQQVWPGAVPFVRAPMLGEWIYMPNRQWSQVTGISHSWSNKTPVLTVRVGRSQARPA